MKLRIPAKTDHIDEVYRFLEACMHDKALNSSTRHNIVTACVEIFTNIAKYAYTPDEGDVTLSVAAGHDQVVVEFRDEGRPFNPLEQDPPDLTIPVEEREPGGLGILLTKQLMDELVYEYDCGQNILIMRKRR